jgi:hypothetical protein
MTDDAGYWLNCTKYEGENPHGEYGVRAETGTKHHLLLTRFSYCRPDTTVAAPSGRQFLDCCEE